MSRHGQPPAAAARGVRGHAVVPGTRVPVDARPVRHQNGRVGGRVRAVRDGHRAAVVRRRGRGRAASENRRDAGRPGPAADRPVRQARRRVVRAGPTVRRRQRQGDRGCRAALGVPAVPAGVRRAQGHDRVRSGQEAVGRPATAQGVLPRDEVHRVRARDQRIQRVAEKF